MDTKYVSRMRSSHERPGLALIHPAFAMQGLKFQTFRAAWCAPSLWIDAARSQPRDNEMKSSPYILSALVAGLAVWTAVEIGKNDSDLKSSPDQEVSMLRLRDAGTNDRRTISESASSRLENEEPKNFVLRRQRTRPASQESTEEDTLSMPTQEFEFVGEKILIGEVAVMNVETGKLTEGFGIYFNEELGALTDGEIRIKQSASGEIQSIYLPDTCVVLSDKATLIMTRVLFREGDGGITFITPDPAGIEAFPQTIESNPGVDSN